VGFAALAGLPLPAWGEWLAFPLVSIVALALFRPRLVARFAHGKEVDSLIGETAVATEAVAPGDDGRAEMRGTTWKIHNLGAEPIAAGKKCRIERVEGVTLFVR